MSDISIKQPVFAMVVSSVLVFGIASLMGLPVREYRTLIRRLYPFPLITPALPPKWWIPRLPR